MSSVSTSSKVAFRRVRKVGGEEYLEKDFDLKYALKKEFLERLLSIMPSLRPQSLAGPVECFISYAWPEKGHKNYEDQKYHALWVERLAGLLEKAGLKVFFDKWKDGVGSSIEKFLKHLEVPSMSVLVIGTELYAEKCSREPGRHVVQKEDEKIGKMDIKQIFPILLEGTREKSFTSNVRRDADLIPSHFVDNDYFETVLRLVQRLYGIDNRDEKFEGMLLNLKTAVTCIEEQFRVEDEKKYEEAATKGVLALWQLHSERIAKIALDPRLGPRHHAAREIFQQLFPGQSPEPPTDWTLKQWRELVLKNEDVAKDLELYVPVRGSSSPYGNNPLDLEKQVFEFLDDKEAEVLLLLGGSGSGKSLFGQYLERKLWREPECVKDRIPLWISLPGLSSPWGRAIEEALELKGISKTQIPHLKRELSFLFVLDGYDEIRGNENLYTSNKLWEWKAKVLITCRQEYFMGDPDGYRHKFRPVRNRELAISGLWERYMAPFSRDEITQYLQGYVEHRKPLWPLAQYQKQMEELPGLRGLMETPFLLKVAAEVLPRVVEHRERGEEVQKLTRLKLYEEFINLWFDRHLVHYGNREEQGEFIAKYGKSQLELLGEEPVSVLRNFSERLAMKMYREGLDAAPGEEGEMPAWRDFFGDELRTKLIRRACSLKKMGPYRHTFIHRSLLEYFITSALLKDIHRMGKTGKDEASVVVSTASSSLEALNHKLLNSEPSIVHFLADAVRSSSSLRDKLFAILEASKRDVRVATAAANAATILNAARASFVGRDLSHAKLPGADLSYGIYDSTNFEGADLRDVGLRGAWLHRVNFQNAQMQGVQFGEYPSLSFNGGIQSCCYSPDGHWLAVACGEAIEILDAVTWKKRWSLAGHTRLVWSVAFSPDGRKVVSGSHDKTVRLWDIERGESLLKPLEGHTSFVMSVAFSPDGRKVVSGSADKTARLWDVERGKPLLKPLEGHTSSVMSVAFSPDGRKVVSGSWDKTVRLWDVELWTSLLKLFEGHTDYVRSVAFSPDGRKLVSGSGDKTVRLWDAQCGEPRGEPLLKPLEGHTAAVTSVAFSADGRKVVSGSDDQTVRLWDIERGEALSRPLGGHTDCVKSVAFSPDGRRVVSGSSDKTVRLWDIERGEPLLRPLGGHAKSVTSVAFSPDGRKAVSGSWDGTVRLWDTERGEPLLKPLERHIRGVMGVAFSPDGRKVVSGGWDRTVRLWDVERGEPLLKPLEGHTDGVTSVAFSPDGRKVVSGSWDKTVRLWETERGASLLKPLEGGHTDDGTSDVTSVAFSPDGRKVVSGSDDQMVRLWDVERGGPLLEPLEGHRSFVKSVAFSPDGGKVASGSEDQTVRLWDVECGKVLLKLEGHTDGVASIAFNPDGELVASVGLDGVLMVHDSETGRICGSVHTLGFVTSVAWNRSIRLSTASSGDEVSSLVTGHADTSVRYWRWENHQLTLLWSSHQGTLVSDKANIRGTQLSDENAKLLKQRGAIEILLEDQERKLGEELKVSQGMANAHSAEAGSRYRRIVRAILHSIGDTAPAASSSRQAITSLQGWTSRCSRLFSRHTCGIM